MKIKKYLPTVLAILLFVPSIWTLSTNFDRYKETLFVVIMFAGILFVFHVCFLLFPQKMLDFCWKIVDALPEEWEYDHARKNIAKCCKGLLIAVWLFQLIGFLIIGFS